MNITATAEPRPVIGWDADRTEWLAARRNGISASDVGAVLGCSEYATPWEVWADKTGLRPADAVDNEAIRLGNELEPWLIAKADALLQVPVRRTPARTYAHPDVPWQFASPDAVAIPPSGDPFGIEAKTAGLASGFGIPEGWSEVRIPLGYEFQARWQMRVMNWQRVDVIGLIAGIGVRMWPIHRDLVLEADMVNQVQEWYERHVVRRVEPPFSPRDNALMADIWPTPTLGSVALDNDPDIVELLYTHAEGHEREKAGRDTKNAAAAGIKRKLGNHEIGTLDGRPVATWSADINGVRRLIVKGM